MNWSWLLWFLLYMAVIVAVPSRKVCRGYLTRLLARIIPPRRWWYPQGRYTNGMYRGLVWWVFSIVLETIADLSGGAQDLVFWGGLIVFFLDDYVNGDDEDPKKRWESAKNKIKWKMKLPVPQPVRGDGTS